MPAAQNMALPRPRRYQGAEKDRIDTHYALWLVTRHPDTPPYFGVDRGRQAESSLLPNRTPYWRGRRLQHGKWPYSGLPSPQTTKNQMEDVPYV